MTRDTGEEIEPNTKINISDTFDPEIPHHFFSKKEIKSFLKDFLILEMNERERLSAKNYKKFKHWDIVARYNPKSAESGFPLNLCSIKF